MSQDSAPISVSTLPPPYAMDSETVEDLKVKLDEVLSQLTDMELLIAAQMSDVNEFADNIQANIETTVREELLKVKKELVTSFKTIITDALRPHRRLVPAVQSKIPQSATDLTEDEEEEEEEEEEDSEDEIRPAQRSKRSRLERYIEH